MKRAVTVRGLLGACLATLVIGALIPMVTIFVVQSTVDEQADRTEQLSLSNCSDINENTQGLYELLQILGTMVEGGALGPDANIEITEPALNKCKGEDAGEFKTKDKKDLETKKYKAPKDAEPLPGQQ
jgi:hypothetical protein